MQCPVCNNDIGAKQKHVCPNCYCVIDEFARTESELTVDFSNRPLTEIQINKTKVRQRKYMNYHLYETNKEIEQIPTRFQNFIASFPAILSVLVSVFLGFIINWFIGILVFVVSISVSTIWMTLYVQNIMKPKSIAIAKLPIRYYINNDVLMCVQVELQNRKLKYPIKYSFLEIEKQNIAALQYHKTNMFYALHLHYPINGLNVVYLPDVFEENQLSVLIKDNTQ